MPAKKKSKKVTKKKSTKRGSTKRTSTKKKSTTRKNTRVQRSFLKTVWGLIWRLGLFAALVLVALFAYFDVIITKKFEGQKWSLPAHVYTRPLDIYVGQKISQSEILNELAELGYKAKSSAADVTRVGQYSVDANQSVSIYLREFVFWNEIQPAQKAKISWSGQTIVDILADNQSADDIRLEPRLFGSVSPLSHEDRSLITLEETPQPLIDALLVMEDRKFYRHFGVDPFGILRAMIRNVAAGKTVQGGSTLTQQLVKNYFLTSERTIKRKLTEMIMAVLLEVHYSKEAILQAYLNEVHLGQAGNRAIHGFGLGSQFIFGRPINELELHEFATLAGMVKGTTRYNPIRNPKNALKRRNLVLDVMAQEGLIEESVAVAQKSKPITTASNARSQSSRSYPAFSDLVRQQIQQDYETSDLEAAGLRIFTTLDPRIQSHLDQSMREEIDAIEVDRSLPKGTLQAAAVTVRTDSGEVVAIAGGRDSAVSGFNRALSAQRPMGSLIKPFVMLSALKNNPERYQLNTIIADKPVIISQKGSPDWEPKNYDKRYRDQIMLIDVLAKSYNVPTVNVGMDIGLDVFTKDLQTFGAQKKHQRLPSILLGSLDYSPIEVANLYLTIASGGFRTPIKSVRSVLTAEQTPLERYALDIEQVIEPKFNNLISYALQEVVRSGTARGLHSHISPALGIAGKTGTTDDFRDSWFAGFSGNLLTVIWVGRDDNEKTGLTGSSGAARVWGKYMSKLELQAVDLDLESDVVMMSVPTYSEDALGYDCIAKRELPILLMSGESETQSMFCEESSDLFEENDYNDGIPSPIWREKKNVLNRWLERIFK